MASIKEMRFKIRSLKNTNKITAAMKLVASSKLRKAQEANKANRPYAQKVREILGRVAAATSAHPLMSKRKISKVRFYVFSSDKGLCGSFNNALFKFLNNSLSTLVNREDYAADSISFETYAVGRKAVDFTSKREQFGFVEAVDSMSRVVDFDKIDAIMQHAHDDFLAGKVDVVYMVYNHYESILKQTPSIQQILPVQPSELPAEAKSDKIEAEYILEPSSEEVLDDLIPRYLSSQYYQALLETHVGEYSARMTAMDAATKNSKELIRKKTIVMNRLRQAAITTELTEIVSGAESLKD